MPERQPGDAGLRLGMVTAAYGGVRPDRPLDYYLRPLGDFVRRYRQSGGTAELIVHANPPSWRAAGELARMVDVALTDEPEDHVGAVWGDPEWQETYRDVLRLNPTHCDSYQARFPRLIGVYLCKLRLIDLAFQQGHDIVLWHDAGHWVSHGCGHDLESYTADVGPDLTDGARFDKILRTMSSSHPVLGSLSRPGRERFHMPLAWMGEHAARVDPGREANLLRSLYTAVFWLFRRDQFHAFFDRFKAAWAELIDHGHAGIEENALTIAAWSLGIPGIPYGGWRKAIEGGGVPPPLSPGEQA